MYLEYFGLNEYPFVTSPDPRFFYPSAKHREALACLLYTVRQRKGFALITGEVGAGKSMLCRAALERFDENVDAAVVVHTILTPKQFFQAVCSEFHLDTRQKTKLELINDLKDFLIDRSKQGFTTVLIVDEAQNLSFSVLEEVRLLGNLETTTEKLMQIILVGQPELRRLIGMHQLRQLDQRITVKFHLGKLSPEDAEAYISHRLEIVGAQGRTIFDQGAKEEIVESSGGVPRLINVLSDQALLQAYIQDEPTVTRDTVKWVVSEREGYYMDRPVEMVERQEPRAAHRRTPGPARLEHPVNRVY